jgi:long-subunit fatty acid transport protein
MFLRPLSVGLLSTLSLSLLAKAQTNTEDFAHLQFNFNNPGARAVAMGGTFLAIADDATAAESNPAGLTALIRPEFSLEFKNISYTRNVPHFSTAGTYPTAFELQAKDFSNSVLGISFLSLVFPKGDWTFSFFRHEMINFESSFATDKTNIAYVPGRTDNVAYFPVESDLDIGTANIGLAFGRRLGERLSLGASFGFSQMKVASRLNRYNFNGDLRQTFTVDDEDADLFFNLGILLHASEKVSFGAIYKGRPKFNVDLTHQFGSDTEVSTLNFNIPSSIGGGVAIRPTGRLITSFDLVFVRYSSLTEDFVVTEATDLTTGSDFQAQDEMEVHIGSEYVAFLGSMDLFLRGGVFIEPDNSIEFTGTSNNDYTRSTRFLFTEGDPDTHFSFGLGLVPNDKLQVDAAVDLSKASDEVVFSFVYRL